ncbi:hypothetical protein [Coraliomargarita parva]|uniref:hypothetical protein n=1 Tax=Coraliomargarita parva TaxID=3014050 RepID=UPI0022B55486|nr:hypothetical protein [Coraliomargarita parva]
MDIQLRFKVLLPDRPDVSELERDAVITLDTDSVDDNILYLIRSRIEPYERIDVDFLDVSDTTQLTRPRREWSSKVMNVCRLVAKIDPESGDFAMTAGGTFKDVETWVPDLLPCSGEGLDDFIDGLLKDDQRIGVEIEIARRRLGEQED